MKRLPGLLVLLFLCGFSCLAAAEPLPRPADLLPRPAALEPDVQFWIRVYTQISTDAGFIHDQHDLSIVYETLHFGVGMSPRQRQHEVDAERLRLHDILLRLTRGAPPATPEERRVRALWGDAPPARLAAAADDVRFQLGQADRFRAGLVRAGAWQSDIAQVLSSQGLPPQLAVLPDVESSFNPAAYSKVGAAGLWQFLRSTGRRFLRINAAVDERFDPYRETEAAAQLLAYNYRLLGTWPLAITAYNHGAAGMLRAREQLGTTDIVRILRDYHSPTFGFASRNFYVSFLAALAVTQDPHRYFGDLPRTTPIEFHEIRMPARAGVAQLLRSLDVGRHTLEQLNPALRPAVWSGRRAIPAGYRLRLPASDTEWTSQLLAQRLTVAHAVPVVAMSAAHAVGPASLQIDAAMAKGPQFYLVQPQDTVVSIADRTGLPPDRLMMLNALPGPDFLYEGERLRLVPGVPLPAAATLGAAMPAAETPGGEPAITAAGTLGGESAVLLAQQGQSQQAQSASPQLLPGTFGPQSADPADPVDYSVAADGSIRVVAAETLGHYAEWLGTSAARLRALNHLRGRTPVVIGRRLKLQFDTVSRGEFEQRRRQYHEQLQAVYFASHRITGTREYSARRGDSLWSITRHDLEIPIWLLQQYNPGLDFNALRPGTQVALPQVERVAAL